MECKNGQNLVIDIEFSLLIFYDTSVLEIRD